MAQLTKKLLSTKANPHFVIYQFVNCSWTAIYLINSLNLEYFKTLLINLQNTHLQYFDLNGSINDSLQPCKYLKQKSAYSRLHIFSTNVSEEKQTKVPMFPNYDSYQTPVYISHNEEPTGIKRSSATFRNPQLADTTNRANERILSVLLFKSAMFCNLTT